MNYDFYVKKCNNEDLNCVETVIEITGPKGVEAFHFGFPIDDFKGQIFINNNGVLFGAAEATMDPFFFVLIYGRGGFPGRFIGGNGISWISGNKAMMSLGWSKSPFEGMDPSSKPLLTALDLDPNGVATGKLEYISGSGPKYTVHKKWSTS